MKYENHGVIFITGDFFSQAIELGEVVDNIFIDPTNGHMWLAVFPRPFNIFPYIMDRSYPVENRVLHISLFEEEDAPFSHSRSKTEEIFATDGTEFGAVSVGVYSNNKLLLGTVGLNFMFCDHVQPSF